MTPTRKKKELGTKMYICDIVANTTMARLEDNPKSFFTLFIAAFDVYAMAINK